MEIELTRTVPVLPILATLLLYWSAVVGLWRQRGRRQSAAAVRQAADHADGPEFLVSVRISLAELLVLLFALLLPVVVLLALTVLK
jgi:hypothetical protein